jgi:hypothetical protein
MCSGACSLRCDGFANKKFPGKNDEPTPVIPCDVSGKERQIKPGGKARSTTAFFGRIGFRFPYNLFF